MKSEVFNVELDRFKNENVRRSAEIILNMLPDYFYEVPASSSGKYHPYFDLGEEGLVRHTKATMIFLEAMFRNELFGIYDDYTKDLIRMAMILHDGLKNGPIDCGHTVCDHSIIMSEFVLDNKEILLISEEDANFVSRLILTHGGPWNTDREGNIIMPKPETQAEILVHLCDYVASREFVGIFFKGNNVVVDNVIGRGPSLKLDK